MKRFVVEISDEALNDMERLYQYIANVLQAPEYASKQYDRIANEILKLNVFPNRYPVFVTGIENIQELRCMPIKHYSVFYVVKDNKVIVTNVLYNGSNMDKRLNR